MYCSDKIMWFAVRYVFEHLLHSSEAVQIGNNIAAAVATVLRRVFFCALCALCHLIFTIVQRSLE